jgi:hypothetical protein
VPAGTRVTGATAVALTPRPFPSREPGPPPVAASLPGPRARAAAVLVSPVSPRDLPAGLPERRVDASAIAALDPADVGALIVVGNALPRRTAGGLDVPAALARYLDAGGALVFWGATMMERGTMGETGGVIEWWEPRPWVRAAPVAGWELQLSRQDAAVARADERGTREGWARATATDAGWLPITVGKAWEDVLHEPYDGWAWYRARFTLPAAAHGKPVVIEPGRIDDRDWTFVNGLEIGTTSDWQAIRRYRIAPGDPAYASLSFGGENTLAIQVLDTGGGGGLYVDTPRVGIETDSIAWTPIDPKSGQPSDRPIRLGVVSWGPGGRFFNSWETARGAFGFRIDGRGVEFAGSLAGLPALDTPVTEAFTDFAVAKPWRFEPLAFTTTHRGILVPEGGERYPCAARLVDTATGGEFILLPASLTRAVDARSLLSRLGLGGAR